MKRVLENESMELPQEALAYDAIVSGQQGQLIDQCFARSVLKVLGGSGGYVLDVGTGTGRIPIQINRLAWGGRLTIFAVDLSASMLEIARQNRDQPHQNSRVVLLQADGKKLPFKNHFFDLVISNVALHHLAEPVLALKEINRVVKPEGGLLIRDLRRPPNIFLVYLYVRLFGRHFNPLQKKMFKASLMAGFSKKEMHTMAESAGFKGFSTRGYFLTHVGIEKFRQPPIPFEQKKKVKFIEKNPSLMFTLMKSLYTSKIPASQQRRRSHERD